MRPVEWVQAQPLVAAGVLGLLVGLVLGLVWPVSVPKPEKGRAEAWLAPQGLEGARPRDSEFTAVRDAPIWGDAASGALGVKRAVWSLTGIIFDPLPAVLVLAQGTTDVKRIRAGETLPDGGVVKQIMSSSLSFVREGCTYERLLYGPVEPAENEPCDLDAQAVK